MKLERIGVDFDATEDRLRVKVFFEGSSELSFWLTRRLVRRFWPLLLTMAEARPEIQRQTSRETREALLGFAHEKALREVQFSKATPEPGRTRPLGEVPLLVSRVRARRRSDGTTVLSLRPAAGGGVDLALGESLLHGLMKLLQDAVAKAEWELALAVPSVAFPAPAEGEVGPTLQ